MLPDRMDIEVWRRVLTRCTLIWKWLGGEREGERNVLMELSMEGLHGDAWRKRWTHPSSHLVKDPLSENH